MVEPPYLCLAIYQIHRKLIISILRVQEVFVAANKIPRTKVMKWRYFWKCWLLNIDGIVSIEVCCQIFSLMT